MARDKEKHKAYMKSYNEANKEQKKAYYEVNKEKLKKQQKAYNEANKEKVKEQHKTYYKSGNGKNVKLLRNYNLSLQEYNQLFDKQLGCCAICNTHQSEFKKALPVDHDHDTGKVRGLLCFQCNSGIGQLKDSEATVIDAKLYLTRHNRSQRYREMFPEEFTS